MPIERLIAKQTNRSSTWLAPEKVKAFKEAYAECEHVGEDYFNFEGKPVLKSYAEYLLEYVESEPRPPVTSQWAEWADSDWLWSCPEAWGIKKR